MFGRNYTLIDLNTVRIMFTALIVASTLLLNASPSTANTIEPYLKEYLISQGSSVVDTFYFTNTSSESRSFLLTVEHYNPKNEEVITGDKLVTPKVLRMTLDAGERVEIPFTVEIGRTTTPGSIFNLIVIEEDDLNNPVEDVISIQKGYGIIIAMHVVETGGTVKGAFRDFSNIALGIIDKGFPLLRETQLQYTYDNNSLYVFEPIGEIRIYDKKTNERVYKEKINPDNQKVYPDETYSQMFKFQLWDITNFRRPLDVVVRTYDQFENSYIERRATITPPPLVEYLGGALIASTLLLFTVRKLLKKKREQ